MPAQIKKYTYWLALAGLVVPMFASYYFDDMFSTLSHLFENGALTELGWNAADYGLYTSGYSVLCVFGGLVICGMLLDRWGIRITGSIFVGLMVAGAGVVTWAITGGYSPKVSLSIAYVGCMLFGLGSEIVGVTVNRAIAKWFKGKNMAFAMGVQLSISRLGTAFALMIAPVLVTAKAAGETYSLMETARPAFLGMLLMALGLVLWIVFVGLDASFDKVNGITTSRTETADEDKFRFSDLLHLFKNKRFIMIALLCVFFYSSIVSFKKFASAILIPRFDVPVAAASIMITMLPFATVIFAPIFGILVDKVGKATRWMIVGAVLTVIAHIMLAFAPEGNSVYGYVSMVFLGFGYSLVPAALWPSVPKLVPVKVLGTAFALVYWVQNLGLMSFKMLAGDILQANSEAGNLPVVGAERAELLFFTISIVALILALMLRSSSKKAPELMLDEPVK